MICVAFDLKAKTYRHLLYDGYKAGRKGMPEELAQQLPVMKSVLDAFGIIRAECEGLEADDIIGIIYTFYSQFMYFLSTIIYFCKYICCLWSN